MEVRTADPGETSALARLWHEAWQDARTAIVPEKLTRARTLASFRQRLDAGLAETCVIGPLGAPLGLCMLKVDELHQMFVARKARGTSVAAALIADAEATLRRHGVAVGRLACAVGNGRAAHFYEKSGWRRTGAVVTRLDTIDETFGLQVWRYEKRLLHL